MPKRPQPHLLNFLVVPIALALCAGKGDADPIALANSASFTSEVSTNESNVGGQAIDTAVVTSLPFVTPVTDHMGFVGNGLANGTLIPTLTANDLNFAYSGSVMAPASFTTSAGSNGDIFFTAGANVTYSLSGNLTTTGTGVSSELFLTLRDVTSDPNNFLYYNITTFTGAGSVTLNSPDGSVDGSASGSLISGDVYELHAVEVLSSLNDNSTAANGNLVGDIEASFAQGQVQAPEPGTAPLLAFGAAFASWALLRKRLEA